MSREIVEYIYTCNECGATTYDADYPVGWAPADANWDATEDDHPDMCQNCVKNSHD